MKNERGRVIMDLLITLDRCVVRFLKMIALGCFGVLMVLLSAVVFVRFVPISSLAWSDDIIEWAFSWMVFMGAAVLWRDNEHFRVEWLEHRLSGKKSGRVIELIVKLFSIFFLAVMTYYGTMLTLRAHDVTPGLNLPKHFWYACVPLSGLIMIAYSIRGLVQNVIDQKNREL
jgi:TRAP-type C4-dicarboxylate transport system permease small subunit